MEIRRLTNTRNTRNRSSSRQSHRKNTDLSMLSIDWGAQEEIAERWYQGYVRERPSRRYWYTVRMSCRIGRDWVSLGNHEVYAADPMKAVFLAYQREPSATQARVL